MKKITIPLTEHNDDAWWRKQYVMMPVWMLVAVLPVLKMILHHHHKHVYDILRYSTAHLVNHLSLYCEYPSEYSNIFLYSPTFPVFIAPFAAMPEYIGCLLFYACIALCMYFSICNNVFSRKQQSFIIWFTILEMGTCHFGGQINALVAGLIILSFVFTEKGKEHWATFFIVAGIFLKLYGVAGFSFFFFAKNKLRFIYSSILWTGLFFVLPMFITGPEYIIDEYKDWFTTLTAKNSRNIFALGQNISLLGIVRKWTMCATYSDFWVLIPSVLAFFSCYRRTNLFHNQSFRKMILASVLMAVCLLSTGTESVTYVIAVAGVAIWYCVAPWNHSTLDKVLLIMVYVITCFSYTDVCPEQFRDALIVPYAIKALPVVLVWFKLLYDVNTKSFAAA